VRFFNTTRPYSELGYVTGSKSQIIELLHTQNIRPYWNVALQYRLVNSPGSFQNQNTNHNNYLVSSWYQSPKKRYNNYLVLLSNKLQSSESGGLADISLLDSPNRKFSTMPTRIGGDQEQRNNFFDPTFSTSNRYKEFNFLLRQQYDLGRKDSIVTDSSVIPLFYPRLRFEHSFKTGKYNYAFSDLQADSGFYKDIYGITLSHPKDSISLIDDWRELSNDFSIYQFPDAKNLHQFIKLGIEYQLINGKFDSGRIKQSFHNFIAHGEYRNQSRNQKWDIEAFGKLFLNGFNSGDYHAYISLQRLLSKSIGSLQLGFENINRSPSYIYDSHSSFYLDDPSKSFSKENTLHFFGVSRIPKLNLRLSADYFLISNYLYFSNYYHAEQESALFNFLRISASKTFHIAKYWNLYSDIWMQQKTGSIALNTPFLYTRQRLAFEGVFFKNLNLSTGLEMRYHIPYNADNYSPALGQFFYQDSTTISNLPDITAFMHFRIRSFKAYIRAENLNSLEFSKKGVGFTNVNLAAPGYAYPGLLIRFGIYWSFIN
ncbi:MAG: putative porin, partial [Ginsengibacter sp.]